jgi:AcrR family transcriptional regulator
MARKQGTRNARYGERRAELVARLRERLEQRGDAPPSWRELAAAAGVSLSTLSHYFGRREDVVRAVMEHDLAAGAEPLALMAEPSGPFARSIADALRHVTEGFRYGGLGAMFARGLVEGLGHEAIGPAFLHSALEPTLLAAERRLQAHIDRGEMRAVDPRGPAIALISPVLLAFLHQNELGGVVVRPLDTEAFVHEHGAAFVRAWQA